ncbi:hypothetical protein BGY98DRAFT_1029990 [Russula aff. rugulosa BPL654]|nr:hypothetical protein BGY98DRAFT_1029990 [Russula aff. rugulosa BPL654]
MERFEDLGKQLEAHISHTRYLKLMDGIFRLLTSLRLQNCDIGWKSPLFKGLRILKIHVLSEEARPELNYWLDALNEIPQLKELSLRYATPVAPLADPLISRTVTLPSLTHFFIHASGKDCALASLILCATGDPIRCPKRFCVAGLRTNSEHSNW